MEWLVLIMVDLSLVIGAFLLGTWVGENSKE